MPTLRDLVTTLRQRDGVAAALVVGRDGLVIDGTLDPSLDPDTLAAHVPPLLLSAGALGAAARQSEVRLLVCELDEGSLVLDPLGPEAALLVLLRPEGDLAALVYDLRRHRERLAALT